MKRIEFDNREDKEMYDTLTNKILELRKKARLIEARGNAIRKKFQKEQKKWESVLNQILSFNRMRLELKKNRKKKKK